MLGFDSLLKFSDENHRPVIVSLIGLLMVGAFTGGLLIQNLQTSLAQRDELEKKRVNILENACAAGRQDLRAQLRMLSERADAYQTEFKYADEELSNLHDELLELGQTSNSIPSAKMAGFADKISARRKRLAFLSDTLKYVRRDAEIEGEVQGRAEDQNLRCPRDLLHGNHYYRSSFCYRASLLECWLRHHLSSSTFCDESERAKCLSRESVYTFEVELVSLGGRRC